MRHVNWFEGMLLNELIPLFKCRCIHGILASSGIGLCGAPALEILVNWAGISHLHVEY
jgi:hypothetical protein